MDDTLCERIRMAAMALEDGEQPEMPPHEIMAHLDACAACRREVAAMGDVVALFSRVERRYEQADLWPAVSAGLEPVSSRWREWVHSPVMLAVVLLLGIYKIAELAMESDPAPLLRIAPLIVAAAFFFYLRNNPFRIEPGLLLKGEQIS